MDIPFAHRAASHKTKPRLTTDRVFLGIEFAEIGRNFEPGRGEGLPEHSQDRSLVIIGRRVGRRQSGLERQCSLDTHFRLDNPLP